MTLRSLLVSLLLSLAIYYTYGQFNLAWISVLPIVLTLSIVRLRDPKTGLELTSLVVILSFLALAAFSLLPDSPLLKSVIVDVANQTYLPWMRGLFALAGALTIALALYAKRPILALCIFIGITCAMTVAYTLIIPTSPSPYIDVWTLHEQAADAFVHFQNPYTVEYTNVYPKELWPTLTPFGVNYTYLPGVFMWMAPFKAIGLDTRYSQVFAEFLTAFVILAISIRASRGTPRGFLTYVPALVFVCFPMTTFFLVRSWNDDLSVLFFAVAGLALVSGHAWLLFLACNALLLLKQYAILFVPLFIWYAVKAWKRTWLEATLKSTFAAALVCASYALYDWRNFFGSLYGLHWLKHPGVHQVFPDRTDSYSLMNYLHLYAGFKTSWLFVIVMALLAVRMMRSQISPSGLLRSLAAMAFAMVIFAPISFANYYEYAFGLFIVGWAASENPTARAVDSWDWRASWWVPGYVASRSIILFAAGFFVIDTRVFTRIYQALPHFSFSDPISPLSLAPTVSAGLLANVFSRTDFLAFHTLFQISILTIDIGMAFFLFKTRSSTAAKLIFVGGPLLLAPYFLTSAWVLNGACVGLLMVGIQRSGSRKLILSSLIALTGALLLAISLEAGGFDLGLDTFWSPAGLLILLSVSAPLVLRNRLSWLFVSVFALASGLTLVLFLNAELALSGTGPLSSCELVRNGLVALSVMILLRDLLPEDACQPLASSL